MKKLSLVCFLSALLLSTFLLAKKFWEERPFTEWTQEEALELVKKSPWVKENSVSVMGRGRGGSGAGETPGVLSPTRPEPGEITQEQRSDRTVVGGQGQREQGPGAGYRWIRITWLAAPVLKAYARLNQLSQGLSDEEAMQTVAPSPGVVQIGLRGRVLGQLIGPNDEEIEEKTYLKKKSGERIPVAKVMFADNFPRNPLIVLEFPMQIENKPILNLKDKEVQLVVQVGKRKFRPKFKLKKMVVHGVLMI